MPRASWRGFLRLSLVSCPVYLSPATTRTIPIRLRQVWRSAATEQPDAAEESEDDLPDRGGDPQVDEQPTTRGNDLGDYGYQTGAAAPITIRPHDPRTGEEIDKSEVVKGYEFGRSQFVTFTADELKALDAGSSKTIELLFAQQSVSAVHLGRRRAQNHALGSLRRFRECPLCRRARQARDRALLLLGALLDETRERNAFEHSYGLCMPHAARALHLLGGRDESGWSPRSRRAGSRCCAGSSRVARRAALFGRSVRQWTLDRSFYF